MQSQQISDSTPAYQSVLTERPTTEHPAIPPETGWLVVASLVFAALIFGLMGVIHWWEGQPKPTADAEPVRDQEWAHYPQPGDK